MTTLVPIDILVNGQRHAVSVEPWMTLADMLREKLGLKGTHIGCGEGVCGSCTVLIDGTAARSCTTLAAQTGRLAVETVEGLAREERHQIIQQAFVDQFAAQCGFCTSGMLMVVREYLDDPDVVDHADEGAIRNRLNAVACRCTGYQPIVAAVKAAVTQYRASHG